MKHYLMIFVVVFSALSPQWAGAMSFDNNGSHKSHHSAAMAEHTCCDSMEMTSSDQNHSYCPYCAGDCHCDNGQYCQHISPATSVIENEFQHLLLTEAFTSSTSPLFPILFISQQLRPPQFL